MSSKQCKNNLSHGRIFIVFFNYFLFNFFYKKRLLLLFSFSFFILFFVFDFELNEVIYLPFLF